MKSLARPSRRPLGQARFFSYGFPPFPVRSRFIPLTLTEPTQPHASARNRRSAPAGCRLCQAVARHRLRPDPLRVLPGDRFFPMPQGTVADPNRVSLLTNRRRCTRQRPAPSPDTTRRPRYG